MTSPIRLAGLLALTATLVLGIPAAGAATVELLRTGAPLAPSGSPCFSAGRILRPGARAEEVRVYGRSVSGRGAQQGRLLVRDASHFELNSGQDTVVNFMEAPSTPTASGNTPYGFMLGAKRGTPAGTHTVTFQVRVSDGSVSNEISCLVTIVSTLVTVKPPPPPLVKNPFDLVVDPPSFLPGGQSGGPLGGLTTGTLRGPGPTLATPETRITLEARLKPGNTRPPADARRCAFVAVGSNGEVRFSRENNCEHVDLHLPADTYALRLGFGVPGTRLEDLVYTEVRGYIIKSVSSAPVSSPAALSCVSPCTFTSDSCVWPGTGRGATFSCGRQQDCQTGFACISGACREICPANVGCPPSCQVSGGICAERPGITRINRFCSSNRDCDRGYSCVSGECLRPCP